MKYRLTRDDGTEIDVQGALWESVLEIAFLNGWVPAGTEEPRTDSWRRAMAANVSQPPVLAPRRWPSGDYFSGASQYVRPDDASSLAAAVLRAFPMSKVAATGGNGDAPVSDGRPRPERGVALFASGGGFVIGEKPT